MTSGGSVGIGTTGPVGLLHTSLAASGHILMHYAANTLPQFPRTIQNVSASISTNDTTVATGAVIGLNLENSSATNGTYSPLITFSRHSASGNYNSTFASIGGFATGNGVDTNWVNGDLVFGTSDNYGPVERMRILSGGNVGIGTTNPGYKLDVAGHIRSQGNVYTDANYGYGLVGVYSSVRYQGVYAMGDAYKLAADGTTPGSLYGIAWTHENIGGQSKAGLGHQALFMTNGVTQTAIGTGIWTNGNLTVGGGIYCGSYGGINSTPTSYGSLGLIQAKGGYYGVLFGQNTSHANYMYDGSGNGGIYYENYGWSTYYLASTRHLMINTSSDLGYTLGVNGSFYAVTKSSSAKTSKGEFMYYSVEATGHRFEDYGSGELKAGVAKIELDPIFSESISATEPYMVFITLEGDCQGIYVAEKNSQYFLVKEINAGKSSAKFSWRITGTRHGYEGIRLEPMVKGDKEKSEKST
jgi:hypothetical protein